MHALALLTSFAAMGLLALGMPVHARVAWRAERWRQSSSLGWKCAGWIFVLLALTCAIVAGGWAVGLVFWLIALGVAGFGVTLLLTYRARWLPPAVGAALLLGVGWGVLL
jgi:hypothetical protein